MANLAIEPAATIPASAAGDLRRRLTTAAPAVMAVIVLAALVGERWRQMGPYPTGLDGGQWLALGRGYLGGVGRSTDGVYAPLVPLLAGLASDAFGPLLALRLVAMLAFAAVLVAVVALARLGLGWPAAITGLIVVGSASAIIEPIAYGGYPQTLAFAFMLAGCAALSSALHGVPSDDEPADRESRCSAGSSRLIGVSAASLAPREAARGQRLNHRIWAVAAATVAFIAAAVSHHIYGPLALVCGAALWPLWALDPATRGRRGVGLRLAFIALAPGAIVALGLLAAFHAAGYAPPLDAAGLGRLDAFVYATREATPVWIAVICGGVAALLLSGRRLGALGAACAALIGVPGVLFLVYPEARLLPPILCGALLAALSGVERLRWKRPSAITPSMLLSALLLAILVPAGDLMARQYFGYYRTLDQSLVDAAAAIQQIHPASIVAVRADLRGWPIGWWLEGLTSARIAVGSEARWLGFPGERASAMLASDFFDRRLSGDELRALSSRTGVRLLVVREREWIGWQRWLAEPKPPVSILFDDGETLVLRIDSVKQ